MHSKFLSDDLNEKHDISDRGIDGKIRVKWILGKYVVIL
jgi:hypothetical protein